MRLAAKLAAVPIAGAIVFGTTNPWYLASPSGIWTITCLFSTTDADTVAWASGTLIYVNGTTYSISSGNTGNMGARTYIYFDPGASVTVLQTTTTAATAIGPGKALIAVAAPSTDGNIAFFQVFNGAGGLLARTTELGTEAATTVYSTEDAGPLVSSVDNDVLASHTFAAGVDSIVQLTVTFDGSLASGSGTNVFIAGIYCETGGTPSGTALDASQVTSTRTRYAYSAQIAVLANEDVEARFEAMGASPNTTIWDLKFRVEQIKR